MEVGITMVIDNPLKSLITLMFTLSMYWNIMVNYS